MGNYLNIKALADRAKTKIQDKLKPIIIDKTQSGCSTCGNK